MTSRCPFKCFKSSRDIIRFAVKLRIHYGLPLQKGEDMLAERGIYVSYEAIRYWVHRFGPLFVNEIRKRRIKRGFGSNWRWHLDEVFVKINGKLHYLWRVIDHEGEVLEVFVSRHRNGKAAVKVLRNALRRHAKPDEIVTDKCPSYRAALHELKLTVTHKTKQYANNLCEVLHQPFRRRERVLQKFRSHASLQNFASAHASIYNHFNMERNKINRARLKMNRSTANAEWNQLLAI